MNALKTASGKFVSVRQSLVDLVGKSHLEAVCGARAALSGDDAGELLALAREPVEFLPDAFMERQAELLERVGERLIEAGADAPQAGATSRMFHEATSTAKAPLSALGQYRVGEDGRLYLITKSEHYHTPLGHAFPGYGLIDAGAPAGDPECDAQQHARRSTRLLEEELIRAANGLAHDDCGGLESVLAGNDLFSVQPRAESGDRQPRRRGGAQDDAGPLLPRGCLVSQAAIRGPAFRCFLSWAMTTAGCWRTTTGPRF